MLAGDPSDQVEFAVACPTPTDLWHLHALQEQHRKLAGQYPSAYPLRLQRFTASRKGGTTDESSCTPVER